MGIVSLAALVVVAGVGVAQACVTPPRASAGSGQAGPGGAGFDHTSATEARRVDSVTVPKLTWGPCTPKIRTKVECTGIELPLDYDQPGGATIGVAIARLRAARPKQRLGVLFVNPGGPGGSAMDLVLAAALGRGTENPFSSRLRDRFDIVGVEPRGVGHGQPLTCFRSDQERKKVLQDPSGDEPPQEAQERALITAAQGLARACGTTGLPLAASMSTAEVARDLDVVRRVLGERKLTYFGDSYGTYLGQVYANMFPDRVRAIVNDGVVDPVAWAGTPRTADQPVTDRLRSADGEYRALIELLRLCDQAGPARCAFAGSGDSRARFATLAARLRAHPLMDTVNGVRRQAFTYLDLIGAADQGLRSTHPRDLSGLMKVFQQAYQAGEDPARKPPKPSPDPVANNPEFAVTLPAVMCSDSLNPAGPSSWIRAGRQAERRVPYFGWSQVWDSVACARDLWTAQDRNRYPGPFDRRTAHPVLFVGNYYDPATSYQDGAVTSARRLPGSRLLTSNSWGHTAYGTSRCVTDAVDAYLIHGTLPAPGTVCTGPQPFQDSATNR